MNKLKKIFVAIIAILIVAPFVKVNALPVGTIDLRIDEPIIGTSVEPGANGNTIADVKPKWSSKFSLTSYWIEEPNPASPMEALDTTFVADTDYYIFTRIELYGDAEYDQYSKITFNGVEVNSRDIEYHEQVNTIEVITRIRAKAPTVVLPAATQEYTVKFNIINGVDYAEEFVEQKANAENGYKVTNPGHPNTGKGVFIGWYTDQTYTTRFDFDEEITKDTNVYAKYVLQSDIQKQIKEVLDEANFSAVSSLSEIDALNLYFNDPYANFNQTITLKHGTIPTTIGDNIRLYFNNYEVYSGNQLYLEFYYSITDNYGVESFYSYYYVIELAFSNTNTRDESLNELSNTIKDNISGETIFIDYKDMSNTRLYTDEEIIDYIRNKVKTIDTENKFTVEPIFVSSDVFGFEIQVYNYSVALVNNTNVYGYISNSLEYVYKVDVDQDVEDNHASYLESVQEELIDFFVNEKGYNRNDIEFDSQSVSQLYPGSRTYALIGNDRFSIYMIKDKDSILLSKNLMVDSYNYHNREVWSLSYSENKEVIPNYVGTGILEGIEALKEQIINEGYDFFDGYFVHASIPEGKTAEMTFVVGSENNNRRIKVLHRKDNGDIETFEGIVKDGKFTIEITEASPFAVGLGEVVKETNGNPQTYDSVVIYLTIFGLSLVGLLSSIVYKRRLNN